MEKTAPLLEYCVRYARRRANLHEDLHFKDAETGTVTCGIKRRNEKFER